MGVTLKAARVNMGLTQSEAARKLGVTTQTLCNYEKYRKSPTVLMAKKMADLYHTTVDDLFF